MSSKYSPPSRSSADESTLIGMLRIVLRKHLQSVDDMLPAKVLAYDAISNRALLQPMITMVTTTGEKISRAQIAAVPVLRFGAGGFLLKFPVKKNDLGWIKACDRDISIFKQSLSESAPNTFRFHEFSDAMFIPDSMAGVEISEEDENNAVFQNIAGTVRLALWTDHVKITTPHMGIGDTEGYVPNARALLDLQSTTRAFAPPRMTTAQKNAIPAPQEGWTVYDLTTHSLSTYNGSAWS